MSPLFFSSVSISYVVLPETQVENPWPSLGRLPGYVRRPVRLTLPSAGGPVLPVLGPPWIPLIPGCQADSLHPALTRAPLQPELPAVAGDEVLAQQCVCLTCGPLCLQVPFYLLHQPCPWGWNQPDRSTSDCALLACFPLLGWSDCSLGKHFQNADWL